MGSRIDINKPSRLAAVRRPEIKFPEMIGADDPRLTFTIMRFELKFRQFLQVAGANDITGHNAEALWDRLKDASRAGNTLTYLNVPDMLRYIEGAKKHGRNFRPMTDAEFISLPDDVKQRLVGDKWFWVKYGSRCDGSDLLTLRLLGYRGRKVEGDGLRWPVIAVRLVEDKKNPVF